MLTLLLVLALQAPPHPDPAPLFEATRNHSLDKVKTEVAAGADVMAAGLLRTAAIQGPR